MIPLELSLNDDQAQDLLRRLANRLGYTLCQGVELSGQVRAAVSQAMEEGPASLFKVQAIRILRETSGLPVEDARLQIEKCLIGKYGAPYFPNSCSFHSVFIPEVWKRAGKHPLEGEDREKTTARFLATYTGVSYDEAEKAVRTMYRNGWTRERMENES